MYETISVIIPKRPECVDIPVLDCLKNIRYPEDKIETILTTGTYPSRQRNNAVKDARGDILYFFNRDVRLEGDIFEKVLDIFNKDPAIAGVGGPDLTPSDNSYMQRLFGYAMGSYFAHWKMRARYASIGKERFSDEKELLLSNLAIRRDVFLESNGFNERLYPNEENELINRISKMGYKFVYHPDITVYRDRRKTLFAFMKQFYRYGQGRMNQVFIEGIFKNLYFFMPVSLLIYFIILPFTKKSWGVSLPLLVYMFFAVIDAVYLSFKHRRNLVFVLPVLYLIMHISYGIGMLSAIYKAILRGIE